MRFMLVIKTAGVLAAFITGIFKLDPKNGDYPEWAILSASSYIFGTRVVPDIINLGKALIDPGKLETDISRLSMFGPAFIGACIGTAVDIARKGSYGGYHSSYNYNKYYRTTNLSELAAITLTVLEYLVPQSYSPTFEYKCSKALLSGFIGLVIGASSQNRFH